MRKLTSCALLMLLALAGHSNAADGQLGKQLVDKGNKKGALPCASCHGENGGGLAAANFPRLAGLDSAYLAKQLNDYQSGERLNLVMAPHAKALNAQEIEAVSNYYASQTAAVVAVQEDAKILALGKKLVNDGLYQKDLPGCAKCHGPDATGAGSSFPALAGQHAGYISNQLTAWQQNSRKNDPNQMMKAVADRMTKPEIEASALYLASLNSDGSPQNPIPLVEKEKKTKKPTPKDFTLKRYEKQRDGWLKKLPKRIPFTPPSDDEIPNNEYGDMVRYGKDLFNNTQQLRPQNVGNDINCKDCHLGAGRTANTAPIWGAAGNFPAFRKKNKHVNSLEERIAGCFTYSMNGTPPAPRSKEMIALMSYHTFLAKGAPIGADLEGRHYPKLALPAKLPDFERGKTVYQKDCAICHGDQGQGLRLDNKQIYPPLWGDNSFNWGAGMHRISMAANFIKVAMPLGKADLSEQEAWDVAMFMNSHERPQDPRWNNDVSTTRSKAHAHADCLYGIGVDNKILGDIGLPISRQNAVNN